MFSSRWWYSTILVFSYLSGLWFYMRISTFHPLPPLSEVVPDAFEFFVCFIQSFWYLAAVGAPGAASWGTGVADASVTSRSPELCDTLPQREGVG